MKAMKGLLTDFPESENGFEVAKNAILRKIESERITKTDILFNFETARKRGLNYDIRKDIYEKIQKSTLEDVRKFQEQYIQGKNFNIILIGNKDKINFKELQQYGKIRELTLDEIFGFEKVEKIDTESVNQ